MEGTNLLVAEAKFQWVEEWMEMIELQVRESTLSWSLAVKGTRRGGCKVKVYWSCPTPWFFWLITVATKMLLCEDMLTILLHSHCQLIMKENVRPHSDTLRNIYSPIICYLAGETMHSNVLKVSWTPNFLKPSVMTFTLMKGSCDDDPAVFQR